MFWFQGSQQNGNRPVRSKDKVVEGIIDVEDSLALGDFVADSEKCELPIRFCFKALREKRYNLVIIGRVGREVDETLQQLGSAVDQMVQRLIDRCLHLPVYETFEEAVFDDRDQALRQQTDEEKQDQSSIL